MPPGESKTTAATHLSLYAQFINTIEILIPAFLHGNYAVNPVAYIDVCSLNISHLSMSFSGQYFEILYQSELCGKISTCLTFYHRQHSRIVFIIFTLF